MVVVVVVVAILAQGRYKDASDPGEDFGFVTNFWLDAGTCQVLSLRNRDGELTDRLAFAAQRELYPRWAQSVQGAP